MAWAAGGAPQARGAPVAAARPAAATRLPLRAGVRSVATSTAEAPAAPPQTEPCPVSAAAFASALDAGSSLPYTWLSHWRQQEERRAARRALIDGTRGRQQQRLRQLATLLAGGDGAGAAPAARPDPHLQRACEEAPAAGPLAGGNQDGDGGSLDLPPLQQMREMDELAWLASHPGEGDAELAGSGSGVWSHEPPPQQQLPQQQQRRGQRSSQPPQPHAPTHSHILGLESGAAGGGAATAALQGPVSLRVGQDVLSVRPLWISVYQPEEGGPAK